MDATEINAFAAVQVISNTIAIQVHDAQEAQESECECGAIKAYCE